jgi:multiple antibiotic resistance protein
VTIVAVFCLNGAVSGDISYLIALYCKLFVTCSPPITVALYIGMTQGYTAEERWETAKRGLKVAAGILLATLVCGSWILEMVGVAIDGFRIAGGLVLCRLAWTMLHSNIEVAEDTGSERKVKHEDISVVPLAFPTIVGAGTISSTLICKADATNTKELLYVWLVAGLIMLTFYLFFYLICFFSRWFKPAFVSIFAKLSGLLLLAMSVQLVVCGVIGFLPK